MTDKDIEGRSAPDLLTQEPSGAELIAAERARQITVEGWTPSHDDHHTGGDLAYAAACYAAPKAIYTATETHTGFVFWDPWPTGWRRSECDRVRELVKAGALIAAEIDRLRRAGVES